MAAPQSIHIFQKDVRHLWPETLVSLLLFAAFAWSVPFGWHTSEYSQFIPLLAGLLHVLMPIAWLVVIARLIQDESLVGDRQFWTSRPYHWASLLGAKLLYIAVFIYLPFFLMQVYLLKHAGLYPSTVIPALLHNLLLLTVIVIVPITVIAAVTSSFPRLLLSTIGAIVYVLIAGGFFAYMLFQRMPPPHFTDLLFALVIFLPAIALVYQYATRKTQISRILLLAAPLVILLLLAITPATALIHSAYPVAGADAPKLTAIPLPASAETPNAPVRIVRNDVILTLPFQVQGVDDQSNYAIQGTAASFSNAAAHWSSPYLTAFGSAISGSLPYTVVRLTIPQAIFNKVHTTPIDLHLSLAADHLKAKAATTWKSSLLPFSVPGKGVCFYPSRDSDEPAGDPVCRFPLHAPDVLFATAEVAPSSCASPAGPSVPGRASLTGVGSPLDFDPVLLVPLTLATGDPEAQHHYELCPGTPISFLEAQDAGKVRFELDAKAVTLDPYAVRVPTAAGPQAPSVTQIPQ